MQTKQWIVSRRGEVLSLAAQYGASNVRVFESVARGENDAESDVDILVDLEPGRSLFDLGGLLTDLKILLERDVDVVTEKGLRHSLCERVLRDAIRL